MLGYFEEILAQQVVWMEEREDLGYFTPSVFSIPLEEEVFGGEGLLFSRGGANGVEEGRNRGRDRETRQRERGGSPSLGLADEILFGTEFLWGRTLEERRVGMEQGLDLLSVVQGEEWDSVGQVVASGAGLPYSGASTVVEAGNLEFGQKNSSLVESFWGKGQGGSVVTEENPLVERKETAPDTLWKQRGGAQRETVQGRMELAQQGMGASLWSQTGGALPMIAEETRRGMDLLALGMERQIFEMKLEHPLGMEGQSGEVRSQSLVSPVVRGSSGTGGDLVSHSGVWDIDGTGTSTVGKGAFLSSGTEMEKGSLPWGQSTLLEQIESLSRVSAQAGRVERENGSFHLEKSTGISLGGEGTNLVETGMTLRAFDRAVARDARRYDGVMD